MVKVRKQNEKSNKYIQDFEYKNVTECDVQSYYLLNKTAFGEILWTLTWQTNGTNMSQYTS